MRFRDFHKNIKIRIIESFMSSIIGSMIFPFMAIYLAAHFGAKVTGVLLLVNVFIGMGLSFVGGYFADQFGRKKIMAYAETARLFAFVIMAISNSPWFVSPWVTFCMMTVNSICWGLAGPADEAMLIDVSTPAQRNYMYSITYWSSNLSIALGGILGAFLFKHYLFQLFIGMSVMAAITAFIAIFIIEESHLPNHEKVRALRHVVQLFSSYKTVFKDRLFILYVLGGVLVLSMEFHLTNYIGIRLSQDMPKQKLLLWNIDGVKMMGFLRTENTILVAILMLFITRITSRFKDHHLLVTSSVFYTIGYGVIAYSNNMWMLFAMMLMLTLAEVCRVPAEQSYMAALPPDHARSTYMAFGGLRFNLAMLIASVTVTLGAFLNPATMALLITIMGLIGAFIYLSLVPGLNKRKAAVAVDQVS